MSAEGALPKSQELKIRVSYSVFKGKSKAAEEDFHLDLEAWQKKRSIVGGQILAVSYDEIHVKIEDQDTFELVQTGFDVNRDILVHESWVK